MAYYMGVDIGSSASKVVIVDEREQLVSKALVPMGTGTEGPDQAVKTALSALAINSDALNYVVATGYGRITYQAANKNISEISCHAKGVFSLIPSARLIIDIGGQDMKVICLSEQGQIVQFFMNDKCAAGTGRFLEVMARVLGISVDEMGTVDETAAHAVEISSTCTVFAESEVISRLAAGIKPPEILAGIHQSVARKVAGIALRGGIEADVVLTGGVARNSGVIRALEKELRRKMVLPAIPQYTGALGAALFARENSTVTQCMTEE